MLKTSAHITALSALIASSALASTETRVRERGYVVRGELALLPAAEQALAGDWTIAFADRASAVSLEGVARATTADDALVRFASEPFSTGALRLVPNAGARSGLELEHVSVAWIDGKWSVLSVGEFGGRPVLELNGGYATLGSRDSDEIFVTGELVLATTTLRRLGLPTGAPNVVGMLTLIGTPFRDPATPLVSSAPAAPLGFGPDVVCSAIGGAFSEFGAVGGIGAYAVTSTSCNVGTSDAIWIDSGPQSNQHPVIGTQLYRFKSVGGATRFEQIGMSWLVHTFCAADAPGCTQLGPPGSTFDPNPSCDWLGPFATDTLSASFNALQHNLGPRSEVNPWTGAYPYPFILGAGTSGDAIYKRLQVRSTDLDPAQNSGATYWTEVVDLCTDEPDQHKYNNYSVCETTVGPFIGGQYNLAFAGATYPMKTALEQWAAIDPGVALSYVDVPGDGRLYLGRKVTDLGGGQRHYEYALFNMNSDRGAQALSVPLGNGATASNVEFHDVDYHSGEPYALTDWSTSVVPAASIAWSTQPYALDANANALRWSTLYNYRFDSNAAPVLGDVTVTLFKPGVPTAITFTNVEVPGSVCAVASYCTTSTTSNGCNPQMHGTGAASASAPSGFTIRCDAVDGQRAGLIFFGVRTVAVPWSASSTSTRCVDSPVQRTASSNSGGTLGACDGVIALDWNAWRAAHPVGLGSPYSAGQALYAQTWFRDPPAPTGTNLSDGLSFTLCP